MRKIVTLMFLVSVSVRADELIGLRAEYASHFLDPESHLRLSRHLKENGDRLTAFFISESARREYFPEEEFDRAFRVVFRDDRFDNSTKAESQLVAELAATPDDAKKRARLADIYLSRSEWKKAEGELRTATRLSPESFDYVEILAEVLRRDDRAAEAEELVREWRAGHPKSVEAYQARVGALLESKSPEVEKVVEGALALYPDDPTLRFSRALLFQNNGNSDDAAKDFIRAAELSPDSAHIQGWTGRFFLKTKKDNERALSYYLNAYFIDPHFYDSEYAESRIRNVGLERAAKRYELEREAGMSVTKLLADSDPVVVLLAIEEADQKWSNELSTPMIALLGHDDSNNRATAARVLEP